MYKAQQFIEQQYSRKYATEVIKDWLLEENLTPEWDEMYLEWLSKDFGYEPKNQRLSDWKSKLLETDSTNDFIAEVLSVVLANPAGIQLQAVLPQCSRLITSTEDDIEKMTIVAEFLCLFQYEPVYTSYKGGTKGYRFLKPLVKLPEDIVNLVNNTQYLPPMVMKPEPIKNNRVSWATKSESIFLNSNHHDLEVDTQFLDIMNSTPMALDEHMLNWNESSEDTLKVTKSKGITNMLRGFDKFYFIYRFDARERSYASGYQLSPMGDDYRKAQLNLHKQEIITDEIL